MPWVVINQTLYSTSFVAMREGGAQCSLCMELDHLPQDCALAGDQVPVSSSTQGASGASNQAYGSSSKQGSKRAWHIPLQKFVEVIILEPVQAHQSACIGIPV